MQYFFEQLCKYLIFLFTGCSLAIPEPDETNQTLLIIPVESRQTLGKFIWTLHISIKDSSSKDKQNHIIKPNPEMLFSYSTKLKPGKYKITKIIRKANPGFKIGGKKKRRPEKIKNIDDFEILHLLIFLFQYVLRILNL